MILNVRVKALHGEFLFLFSSFDEKFSLEKRLIDSFSDYFFFYSWTQDVKNHLCNFDNITINASSNPHSSIVISDASIRNNVAISILHIHSHDKPVIKTIHHAVNITTTEPKLFIIRCSINQAVGIFNIKHIVIITNSLYTAKRTFESLNHHYIHIKSILLLSPENSENSLKRITIITLNSGIVLVIKIGHYIH